MPQCKEEIQLIDDLYTLLDEHGVRIIGLRKTNLVGYCLSY